MGLSAILVDISLLQASRQYAPKAAMSHLIPKFTPKQPKVLNWC
jgi:hypothetical protein